MLKLQPRPSTAPRAAAPRYIATPCEKICGQYSIVISKPVEPLASPSPVSPAEPAIYVVGPVKAAVETTATEVLAKLNQ